MEFKNTSRRHFLSLLGGTAALTDAATVAAATTRQPQENNPRQLQLVGELSVKEGVGEVSVQGKYAYATTHGKFIVVDISNPENPTRVAEAKVPGVDIHDIKVAGDLVAVSSQGSEERMDGNQPFVTERNIGSHFYDVSDPTSPSFLSTHVEVPGGVHNQFLDMATETAYLCREAPFTDSALKIINVSKPQNPVEIAEWRVETNHPQLDQPTNFIHDVYVQNDLAYLAYWDAGCRVLDVSDTGNPEEVSSFAVSPDATNPVSGDFWELFQNPESEFNQRILGLPGQIHSVKVSSDDQYVFLGTEVFLGPAGGMSIWDLSSFEHPQQVGHIAPPETDDSNPDRTVSQFEVRGDRLFSTWRAAGVRVFDISNHATNPRNPREIGVYDPAEFDAGGIELRGEVIIVGSNRGVTILSDKD